MLVCACCGGYDFGVAGLEGEFVFVDEFEGVVFALDDGYCAVVLEFAEVKSCIVFGFWDLLFEADEWFQSYALCVFDAVAYEFLWEVAGCCFGEFCEVFAFVGFSCHVLLHFLEESLRDEWVFAGLDFVRAVCWV